MGAETVKPYKPVEEWPFLGTDSGAGTPFSASVFQGYGLLRGGHALGMGGRDALPLRVFPLPTYCYTQTICWCSARRLLNCNTKSVTCNALSSIGLLINVQKCAVLAHACSTIFHRCRTLEAEWPASSCRYVIHKQQDCE